MNRGHHRLALLVAVLALICSCGFATGAMAAVVDDDPAAASTGPGNMSIAMRDSAGNLVTRAWAGSQWSPWAAVTGLQLTSGPSMSIRPGPIVDVFARGTDNAIWHTYYTASGGWSAWGSLGGCLASAPASSWRGNGYLDVVAVGCDGQMYMKNWNASTGWTQWFSLGGSIIYKPAIKSYSNGTISVYAVGTDHQLYQNYYNGSWSGWLVLGGYLTSGPTLSNQTESTIDVFARDQGNNVAQRSYNGSSWSNWVTLPTVASSGPAAAAEGNGRVSLFVRGGGDLYTNQFANGAWSGWTSQFPSYPTSWNYGGEPDHSVNTTTEINHLAADMDAGTAAQRDALWAGLSPADKAALPGLNPSTRYSDASDGAIPWLYDDPEDSDTPIAHTASGTTPTPAIAPGNWCAGHITGIAFGKSNKHKYYVGTTSQTVGIYRAALSARVYDCDNGHSRMYFASWWDTSAINVSVRYQMQLVRRSGQSKPYTNSSGQSLLTFSAGSQWLCCNTWSGDPYVEMFPMPDGSAGRTDEARMPIGFTDSSALSPPHTIHVPMSYVPIVQP